MNNKKNIPEIENLSTLIGDFIEYWGFKKIHGQIWFHLYLSEIPLDAAEIMKKLSISKALVSITLKDLLQYEVISESQLSPLGTRTYTANDQLSEVIKKVLRKREQYMLSKIKLAHLEMGKISGDLLEQANVKKTKIKELGKFIKRGERGLDIMMKFI